MFIFIFSKYVGNIVWKLNENYMVETNFFIITLLFGIYYVIYIIKRVMLMDSLRAILCHYYNKKGYVNGFS